MATSVDSTGAKVLLEQAMVQLQEAIKQGMTERGKVATGATMNSITHEVVSYGDVQGGTFGIVGRMAANENWKWVGNGRGPGGRPPIETIERWLDAKGLSLNAWAIANRMAKEGSRDYRLKRTNVFEDEITGWQTENDTLVNAANTLADAMAEVVVVDLQTGLR